MGTNSTDDPVIRDQQLVDMLVGQELGGFRIEAPIGAGGMGTVFRATQQSIGRTVAVKVVRDHTMPNGAARFLREARAISQIDHPNVVQLIDFGHEVDEGLMYYAMEHIDGVPLNVLTKGGRLHPNVVIELGMQLCSALAQTHAAGVVHRDLKASNILVSVVADGTLRLRVLDFGIAATFEDTAKLTRTGVMCGTPAYIAPEQARGLEVTPRVDLYALGVNLHRMLSGSSPFSGGNAITVVIKHLQDPPRDLSIYVDQRQLPGALVELTSELLAKEPEDRPETAADVRRRLAAVRQQQGWEAIEVVPPSVDTLNQNWKRPPLAREAGDLPPLWRMADEDGPTDQLDATDIESRATARSGPIPARSGGGWSAFNRTPAAAAGKQAAVVLDPVTGEYMAVGDDAPKPEPPQRQAASAMALDVDNPRGRTFNTDELQVDLPPRPAPPEELPTHDDDGPDVLKLVGVMLVVCVLFLGLLLLVTSGSEAPPPPPGTEIVVEPITEPAAKSPDERQPTKRRDAPRAKAKPEVEVIDVFDEAEVEDSPRKGPIIIEEGE